MKNVAKRQLEVLSPEENNPALNAILGANPFVGLDASQVLGTLTRLLGHLSAQPANVASRALQLGLELGQIASGESKIEPEPGDKRFVDPAWSEHPIFRRMMQSYLAWRIAMHDLVNDGDSVEWKEIEQQKFALTLLTEALAPTNALLGNPAALKRAFDTSGMSLVSGLRNFVSDLWNNGGMPQQVDKRLFEVGRNLAVSPGEAACEISGSPDCNVLGVCAGGITTALTLGHLAASGDKRVNAATLLVTMLDTSLPSMTGMFATEDAIKAAQDRSAEKGVLDGADMARVFAWLRPNDLVWNYWVNNYLLGKDPAPFDILYWNSDSTNLPANLHAGFLDLFLRNPLTHGGEVAILGTPIDLRAVKNDLYLVAGMTDHICAWRACYRATRMFGGRVEFVLGSSGHIQSLVNPPGNFKARYYIGSKLPENPDEWVKGAAENKGTWWDHWIKWIAARSGGERLAPTSLGSEGFKPGESAPGLYVHEHH